MVYNKRIKEKILIVDDEDDLALILRYNLENEGFKVISALDAESGLKLIREEAPALVLLDVTLPGMDGFELLRVLRRESAVPVFLLSGKSGEADRRRGAELGADEYVVKPFSIEDLQKSIVDRLRRPRPSANG